MISSPIDSAYRQVFFFVFCSLVSDQEEGSIVGINTTLKCRELNDIVMVSTRNSCFIDHSVLYLLNSMELYMNSLVNILREFLSTCNTVMFLFLTFHYCSVIGNFCETGKINALKFTLTKLVIKKFTAFCFVVVFYT